MIKRSKEGGGVREEVGGRQRPTFSHSGYRILDRLPAKQKKYAY